MWGVKNFIWENIVDRGFLVRLTKIILIYIPNGGQFQTFPNSSFAGNEDLFGYEPSSHSSVPEEKPKENQAKSGDGEDTIIGLPFAIGSVTAFVTVVFISYLSGWLFPKERPNKYVEIAWRRIR